MIESIIELINIQAKHEMEASMLYLQMSYWLDANGFKNFSNFFKEQAEDERSHAIKFYDFLNKTLNVVKVYDTVAPKNDWGNALSGISTLIFDYYLREQEVTTDINRLVDVAIKQNAYGAISLLKWFVDEQVESIQLADYLYRRVNNIKDCAGALFAFDDELPDILEEMNKKA